MQSHSASTLLRRQSNASISSVISASLSQASSKSIISDEFLMQREADKIKQSNIKTQSKIIYKWTNVVMGKQFHHQVKAIKFQYTTNSLINSGDVPPSVSQLPVCPIIQLPLEQIDKEVAKFIDVKSLASDDDLCRGLEMFLDEMRSWRTGNIYRAQNVAIEKVRLRHEQIWDECQTFLSSQARFKQVDMNQLLKSNQRQSMKPNPFCRRRDAKTAFKRLQVIEKYKAHGEKPKAIAQQLKVTKEFVYSTMDMFKREVKNRILLNKPISKPGPQSQRENPILLRAIAEVLESVGIYHITAPKLRAQLHEISKSDKAYAGLKVPSAPTLIKILKETFHLRYGASSGANPKYRDQNYNSKRLWISRLLAQFFLEDAVIISIDESNFRSDCFPSKQWSFNCNDLYKTPRPTSEAAPDNLSRSKIFVPDNMIVYAE